MAAAGYSATFKCPCGTGPLRMPRGLILTRMGSRRTATEVGSAKQPGRPFGAPPNQSPIL